MEGCAIPVSRYRHALLAVALLMVAGHAAAGDRGLPLVTWYAPSDYAAGTQNWAVTQDQRGYMYFGNEGVVLVFDGARWRRVPVLSGRAVRSLATTADGSVLVGAQEDFGILEEDVHGSIRYRSLLDRFEGDVPAFRDVWQVIVIGDRWLFSTDTVLFELKPGGTRILRGPGPIAGSFRAGEAIYSYFDGGALMRLGRDGFEPLAGLESLPHAVYAVQALADGDLMIGFRPGGMLRYRPEDGSLRPDWEAAGAELARRHLYHAGRVPDGRIGLATLRGGLMLLDESSGAFEVLDSEQGLPNPTVRHLYVDAEQGLWLALDNGIARLEGRAAIDVWDERKGLRGSPLSALRFQGTLHVGTTLGLYRLVEDRFLPVDGIDSETWALLAYAPTSGPERLLAATSYGIHDVRAVAAERLYGPSLTVAAAISPRMPHRLWIGSYDQGAGFIDLDSAQREPEFILGDVQSRALHVGSGGDLWLETWSDGLLRIDPRQGEVLQRFPGDEGPTESTGLIVLDTSRHRLLAGREGIWHLDADGGIRSAEQLRALLADPGGGSALLVEGPNNVIWSAAVDEHRQRMRVADLRNGMRPHDLDAHLRRLPDIEFYMVYPEADRQAWVGASEALYRVDLSAGGHPRPALGLHMVAASAADAALPLSTRNGPVVLSGQSFPLHFAFAAPRFDWPDGTRYRYRLIGFQDEWSPWRSTADREFSHLPAGEYVLGIEARDVHGQVAALEWTFAVAPPWYFRPAMLAAYLAAAAFAVIVLFRLGGHRQARRSRKLEAVVALRTAELREQQDLLKAERDKLARLSREDELTGLANRRAARERLQIEWSRAARNNGGLALAVIDLDHFKLVNDRFGHECGDRVLQRFAELVGDHCRECDLLARWGGEEFLLLLPDTDLEQARVSCERIRRAVSGADWSILISDLRLTVSIGLATREGCSTWEQMLAAADRCLYRAKSQGRDRVVSDAP